MQSRMLSSPLCVFPKSHATLIFVPFYEDQHVCSFLPIKEMNSIYYVLKYSDSSSFEICACRLLSKNIDLLLHVRNFL